MCIKYICFYKFFDIFKQSFPTILKKDKTYIYKVPNDFQDKIRLSEFVKGLFPYLETGSAVKKAFHKKQIQIDHKIGNTGDWVIAGCEICYEWSYKVIESDFDDKEIYYEDNDLMVVRKPPGIASSGNKKSLQLLLQGIEIEDSEGSLPFPYLVHRLDKATEGLLIAAKTIQSKRLLDSMIQSHAIVKHYVLIVEGVVPKSLKWISQAIDDKPAKTEILQSIPLDTKNPTSKVLVRLHTGRTHQIRKHFTHIGHPIVGDSLYNEDGLTFRTGLLLCACYLEFAHPITEKMVEVTYPIPEKIGKYKIMNS